MVFLCVVLVLLSLAAPAQATYQGRNGAIAFAQDVAVGMGPPYVEYWRLALVSPRDGSRRVLVTATRIASPSYSPDGKTIVFDAGAQIGLIPHAGGRPTLLPAQTADDGDPAFAPDGKRIVFTGANDRGTTDLYVREVDGRAARRIVKNAGEPAWSSRNRIAYVRGGSVYANARHPRFVTSGVSPDWSPDGRRLVVVRPSLGRLYLVRGDGRGLRRVGRIRDASAPAWAPDGRFIAFTLFDSGIYVKRLEGRRAAHVVAESQVGSEGAYVSSFDPAWRPLPR